MVTAKEFIAYVYVPLQESWGYIYGTWGRMWTQKLQEAWEQPSHKNWDQTLQYGSKWIGHMVTDCSGLIRWALYQLHEEIIHQAYYQYTDASKAKGKLVDGKRDDGQPLLPGTAVFLQGDEARIHHVGVYVGHGICIEAKGTRWGVVTSEPAHWDHWGELKAVDYTAAAALEDEPAPEIPERDRPLFRAVVDNPGSWLNVRKGPGTSYNAIGRLTKGDIVDVLSVSQDGAWDEIRYDGKTGWVSAEYLKKVDEEQPEEPEKPEEPEDAQPAHPPDEPPEADPAAAAIQALEEAVRILTEQLTRLRGGG